MRLLASLGSYIAVGWGVAIAVGRDGLTSFFDSLLGWLPIVAVAALLFVAVRASRQWTTAGIAIAATTLVMLLWSRAAEVELPSLSDLEPGLLIAFGLVVAVKLGLTTTLGMSQRRDVAIMQGFSRRHIDLTSPQLRTVRVRALLATTEIDLRSAGLAHGAVRVDVRLLFATLRVVAPPKVPVGLDRELVKFPDRPLDMPEIDDYSIVEIYGISVGSRFERVPPD